MIDLTPIVNAVIALIAAIISVKVIPWIKAKATNEQQAMLRATVKTLVFAAEQIYGALFLGSLTVKQKTVCGCPKTKNNCS